MAEMDDKVIVTKDKITDIADTIRETGGTSSLMTLDEMPDNIRAIGEGGGNVVAPLFVKNGNNYTCNLTFAKIEEIYAGTGDTKASMPQLIYSGNDTRSIYCNVEQENEDAFSFDFNIGAIGITNTGYKEKHIVLIMESDNSISFNREYTLEYQEDMIACKISWDSRLNKYICNKTYAQLKDMYVDNPDSSTKLPFLCTRYGHKSNSCNVQYIEQNHLILILFFMGSIPESIVNDQQLVYMQAIVYEDGTITVGEVYKHYAKPFEPYNGIELAQRTGLSPYLQLTENVRNSIATSLMIGASSGSVASISDGGANMPLKSCMVAIEPVQAGSGDPSPQNERPISGWTECNITRDGKNLLSTTPYSGGGYNQGVGTEITFVETTGVTVSGNTISYSVDNWGGLAFKTPSLPTGNYKLNMDCSTITNARISVYKMSADNKIVDQVNYSSATLLTNGFTINKGEYIAVWVGSTSAQTITITNPQIEIGSSYTGFEAYKGNTYNIEFPSEAGTVYGGTLDVTNGVLTVDRLEIEYDGSSDESWSLWSQPTFNQMYIDLANIVNSADGTPHAICNRFKAITIGQRATIQDGVYTGATTLAFNPSTISTVADWITFLQSNPVTVVYELATPTTYNLTPTEIKTLLGINNIFADTGDVLNAEYTRDATIIINELLERVIALEQGA